MDYLFFDIECSDGKSLCSFGYVLTDENFVVLKKEDILVNPESYFRTAPWSAKGREKDPGISLAYPEISFRRAQPFPAAYGKIAQIINEPGRKIIGFSHANDAKFLNYACERYGMPYLSYGFLDVQKLYCVLIGQKNQIALQKLLDEYEVDVSAFVPHKSDDDATVTALATEALCAARGTSLLSLAALAPSCEGRVENGECKFFGEAPVDKTNMLSGKNYHEFVRLVNSVQVQADGDFTQKNVAVNRGYEKKHYREMCDLVKRLAKAGGRYTAHVENADVYVACDEAEPPVGRYACVLQKREEGASVCVLELADFVAKLPK